MADIFDEVRGDYRADQARRLASRYGWIVAVVLIAVLLGVGGWQYGRLQQRKHDAAAATDFIAAMDLADAPGGPHPAVLPELDAMATAGPDSYQVLAGLRAAAVRDATGDAKGAIAGWDHIAADEQAPPLLRQLAVLLSVQHQVGSAEPNALIARLGALETTDGSWRPLAEETQAWIQLQAGQTVQARALLQRLQKDPAAPGGVRGRARAVLQALGVDTQDATGGLADAVGASAAGAGQGDAE